MEDGGKDLVVDRTGTLMGSYHPLIVAVRCSSNEAEEDKLILILTRSGNFSVVSVYEVIYSSNLGNRDEKWKAIWALERP